MKIISGIAGAIVALVLPFSFASPAEATSCFAGFCIAGFVVHPNDTGYDKSLIVVCAADDPVRHYVKEGTTSDSDCDGEYSDMNAVIVREGEEWWCEKAYSPWWMKKKLTFDATGRHNVGDGFDKQCVVQKD